jgi:ribonuclease HI
VKINWDAALDKQKKLMGVGVMIRDHRGDVIATQCSTWQYITDPAVAEAMALRTAAAVRQQLGIMEVILEGDSLEVVQAVKKEEESWTNFGPIVEEVKDMLKGCHSWKISHVKRTANEVAHKMAKMVVSLNVNQIWVSTIPPCIREIVLVESLINE